MTGETEPQRIVRVLAFALRHHPLRFGVGLDDEGFAGLDELVVGIRFSHYDWATLDRAQVEAAIRGTDPGRFEIRDGLVRARYGHSVALGSPGELQSPPDVLLHGTSADALAAVLATGLRPMNRAFVHLTSDPDYAAQVMTAKGGGEVIAKFADAPLLGQLPLDPRAREWGDAGTPIVQGAPNTEVSREFVRIAERLADRVSVMNALRGGGKAAGLEIDRSGGQGRVKLPIAR